jgi:hypothetical protein
MTAGQAEGLAALAALFAALSYASVVFAALSSIPTF